MKKTETIPLFIISAALFALAALLPSAAFAHCDGLDGPVVIAARKALESGSVTPVLIWVQKKDADAVKEAFQKTLAVRRLDPQAKDLADRYFFETLVRIHRAGEGASYTGLKPAGRDLGPAVPAGDRALEDGKLQPLAKILMQAVEKGLHEQFEQALARKKFKADDVEAGREYVEAYVKYIHYVERLYEAAKVSAHGHYSEPAPEHGH
jgi:hypothetical protein